MNNTYCEYYLSNNSVICFKTYTVEVFNVKGEKITSFHNNLNTINSGVYEYRDKKIGFCNSFNTVLFYDINSTNLVGTLNINDAAISSICFNAYIVAVGTNSNSVRIYNWKLGHQKYVLLLGSMNPKTLPKSFVHNPEKSGCSEVVIDNDRIVVSIGNLIRVYHFDFDI